MNSAYIVVLSFGIRIVAPYNKPFIEDLKDSIPHGYRTYDPEYQSWDVYNNRWEETATRIVQKHHRSITYLEPAFTDKRRTQAQQGEGYARTRSSNGNSDSDYAKLGLAEGASLKLIKAAYRVLSQDVHPDTSGKDGSEFRTLTDAYERLLRKVHT